MITMKQFIIAVVAAFLLYGVSQILYSLLGLITNCIDFLSVLMATKAKKLMPLDEEEECVEAIGFQYSDKNEEEDIEAEEPKSTKRKKK